MKEKLVKFYEWFNGYDRWKSVIVDEIVILQFFSCG